MHIPSSMLHGAICPVTVAVGVVGGGVAVHLSRKVAEKPSAVKFATVTAMIFALQMLNFPVQNGTSGHLLGGMLAVSLLGVPFAVIAMALVLAVQAVFFGDGGINALGANVINMGLIGAAVAGMFFEFLKRKNISQMIALAVASWVSVVLAAMACSLQIAMAGTVTLMKALPAMLSVHALIGVGEAVLTVLVVSLLSRIAQTWKANEGALAVSSLAVAVIAAMLSPFASAFPDGLEWVAGKLAFTSFPAPAVPVLFPEYQVAMISGGALSTILAGILGVGIVLMLAYSTARAMETGLVPVKR